MKAKDCVKIFKIVDKKYLDIHNLKIPSVSFTNIFIADVKDVSWISRRVDFIFWCYYAKISEK